MLSSDAATSFEKEETKILAVIPSIGGPGLKEVVDLQRTLQGLEHVFCVVVSNSRRLTQHLEASKTPFVTDESNGGFGRSVQSGARTDENWRWLLIVNDDINLDADTFSKAVNANLGANNKHPEIVYFDEDVSRPIPGLRDVFLQVSLLGNIIRKLRTPHVSEKESYRSFSCVAISRELFDLNDGFDDDLLFTYEDADFVARARKFGARQRVVGECGVFHSHSLSSGRHIDKVLPVATYSAARYLDKRGSSLAVNSLVILLALLIRLAFVPVTRASKKRHLKGIYFSAKTVILRAHRRPQLPDYAKL